MEKQLYIPGTHTENVTFRFIIMPCCQQQVCWVNPRLPNYCPECGARVYPQVRGCITVSDNDAVLTYHA